VRDIDRDPVKSAIVSAVVALSRAIGSTTVVEGVETLPELEQIQSLGCDMAQGFYFSRPLPAGAFEELLLGSQSPPPHLHVPRGALIRWIEPGRPTRTTHRSEASGTTAT